MDKQGSQFGRNGDNSINRNRSKKSGVDSQFGCRQFNNPHGAIPARHADSIRFVGVSHQREDVGNPASYRLLWNKALKRVTTSLAARQTRSKT